MLYFERGLHAKLGSFLDRKGLRFKRFYGTWCTEVDCYVRAAFDFKCERENDAAAGVRWVDRERRRVANTEGGFPSV